MKRWNGCKFWRSQAGVAMIEFAVALPILILMLFATIELTRYMLINQKLDKATNTMDDLAVRQNTVTDEFLSQITDAMPKFLRPFSHTGAGTVVIFTFVSRDQEEETGPNAQKHPPRVTRQYSKTPGAFSRSKIGHVGGPAAMPNGFVMKPKESVIVAESYYNFKSLLGDTFLPSRELYKVAVMRPRVDQEVQCPTGCTTDPNEPIEPGCFARPTCPAPPCTIRCPCTNQVPHNCDLNNCPCPVCMSCGAEPPPSCGGNPIPRCSMCRPCYTPDQFRPPGCETAPICVCAPCHNPDRPRDPGCPDQPACCRNCYRPGQERPPQCADVPNCPEQCQFCPDGVNRCDGTPPDCDCATCPHL